MRGCSAAGVGEANDALAEDGTIVPCEVLLLLFPAVATLGSVVFFVVPAGMSPNGGLKKLNTRAPKLLF